jgi:hypothetical protein
MGTNERYKQQLATTLTCNNLKENSFENLEYKYNKLLNLITNYNKCEGSETVVYNKKEKGGSFNLSIRPGVAFNSLSILKLGDERINFDNNIGIRIGLELEYVLGFNNGKWSVFTEPTYRTYKAEKEYVYVNMITFQRTTLLNVQYNSIEFPIGARHYMFLNNDTAFFVDAAVLVDVSRLDSKIESSNENSYDFDIKADAALAFGIGFRYKNKYSVGAKYHTSRQLLIYDNVNSSYKSFALIAGYNFL